MSFAGENSFDAIINEAAAAWTVPAALIKGIIAAESEFNPRAYREEPKIGDASYGLMQLLYRTAKALGYSGTSAGLFDPTTNVRLGTRFLADLIKTAAARGFAVDSAVSAYNAGFSSVRPGDGKRVTDTPGAPFVNQTYVDRVIRFASQYSSNAHQLPTVTTYANKSPLTGYQIASLALGAIPLLFLFTKRKRK